MRSWLQPEYETPHLIGEGMAGGTTPTFGFPHILTDPFPIIYAKLRINTEGQTREIKDVASFIVVTCLLPMLFIGFSVDAVVAVFGATEDGHAMVTIVAAYGELGTPTNSAILQNQSVVTMFVRVEIIHISVGDGITRYTIE